MRISFCTTCKGRLQHLRMTLPQNMADNPKSQFVILDYNSQDGLRDYLLDNFNRQMHTGRLAVYSYPSANAFQMAHAKNMAHRAGILEGADVLVNMDADNFTGPAFEDFIQDKMKDHNSFLWACMVKGVMPRGISGRIAVTKQAFMKTGGYDEKYATWSPDDKDFNQRLRLLGYNGVEVDPSYLLAVLHNDRMRFKEYPHVNGQGYGDYEDTFHLKKDVPRTTVANYGNYGCGKVFRNFDFSEEIFFEPQPTRVFGIGMHKTATTSLYHALEILGFESAHWMSAHWAKAIWREMNSQGYSLTLERNFAVSDLPITLLYQKLDKAYPGSKFILTIKDEEQWLDTVRKHWDPTFNTFREGWDQDPFSNRVHAILYGRTTFDAEIFLNRYRKHNADVKEYFKNRPNDLLIMEMDKGAGWLPLCRFLGDLPIPPVGYPRSYASY